MQFAGAHLVTSLLAFNLGVELGQLAVLAVLIPALNLLFRYVKESVGTLLLSLLVGHTAWHWMVERASGWRVSLAFVRSRARSPARSAGSWRSWSLRGSRGSPPKVSAAGGGGSRASASSYLPPVTSMNVPVLNDASSESSQRMACATSSAWPPRFSGTNALTRSTRFGSPPLACISV